MERLKFHGGKIIVRENTALTKFKCSMETCSFSHIFWQKLSRVAAICPLPQQLAWQAWGTQLMSGLPALPGSLLQVWKALGTWLLVVPSTKLNDREPGSRLPGLWSSMGCFILCADVLHGCVRFGLVTFVCFLVWWFFLDLSAKAGIFFFSVPKFLLCFRAE